MALYKVKSYSIDQKEILGTGAFGVVFKGNDAKKNPVAAKRIDGEVHPQILTLAFERFLQLDHPSVMKILDVAKTENIVWLMMPFCELGDLNHFYRERDVSRETKIEEMKQIVAGIRYLHSQDIIHRDIKPGNILVASRNPLRLLLTDFDVSKCLDPEVETSLMTSNVGTLAFKAPEFFQRTSPGKIEYHRNVDIYAAGLTFLAILQAKKGKKMLIPQIETPIDDSELHAPSIGLLIFERIKYKVPELSIVKTEGPRRSLKWLISRMTCVNPEERLTAGVVLAMVSDMKNVEADLPPQIQRLTIGREETCAQVARFHKAAVNKKGQILARIEVNFIFRIQVFDRFGRVSSDIPSECAHRATCLLAHPTNTDYVLESCALCEVIRNYNIRTGKCKIVYEQLGPVRMCCGTNDSILVQMTFLLSPPKVFELKWEKEFEQLCRTRCVYTASGMWKILCYLEAFKILLITNKNHEIEAVEFVSGNPIWKLSGDIDGRVIKPDDITSDRNGNVYVSDGANNRILKINGLNGDVIHIVLLTEENKKPIRFLFWSENKPNLTMIRFDRISTYNIFKI